METNAIYQTLLSVKEISSFSTTRIRSWLCNFSHGLPTVRWALTSNLVDSSTMDGPGLLTLC